MKLAIKLIRYDVGYIGLILLLSVTAVFGMGMQREFAALPVHALLLGIYLYFISQVKRDRQLVIRQLSFLPNYAHVAKRIALTLAAFFAVYMLILQWLVTDVLSLSRLAISGSFSAVAYFVIALFMIRTRELVIGLIFSAAVILTGYYVLTPLLLGFLIFSLRVTIGELRFTSDLSQHGKNVPAVVDPRFGTVLNTEHYLLNYLRLTIRRNDNYRLDVQVFVAVLFILFAYSLHSIYRNQDYSALPYLSVIAAAIFVAAFFFMMLILRDLWPVLEFTGRRGDVKYQLEFIIYCGFLVFIGLLLMGGSYLVGPPADWWFPGFVFVASCFYLETALFLLTQFSGHKYLITFCGLMAVILMLLEPLQQLIVSVSIHLAVLAIIFFGKGKLNA